MRSGVEVDGRVTRHVHHANHFLEGVIIRRFSCFFGSEYYGDITENMLSGEEFGQEIGQNLSSQKASNTRGFKT
ncbi:hypothetical protein Y032_0082g1556 [Ancylostoma ceylanicum]|uniref:Uncharacterized protein n=1 Tax=Ancylostoma ceylanicum TaxID=53326 RepID=A0A016TQS0_9BILA|nr:hypothetical protein Y032_0082g1556 [Ancylostoma ceylanicum]